MRSTFYFLVLLFVSQQISAQTDQPRLFIGIIGGFNKNYHSGTFSLPDTNGLEIKTPGMGTYNGSLYGLAGEYWFTENGTTALQFNIYYEHKPGNFLWIGTPVTFYDTTSNQTYIYSRNHELDIVYDLLNFEALFRYNILPYFGISIGPKFGVVTYTQYILYQIINHIQGIYLLPEEIGQSEYLIQPLKPIPSAYVYHLAIKLSLQYELLLGNFLITPAVSFDYGVTNIAPSWSVNTLAGTVDVKYGL
jgi:hypothetical protein